MYTSKLLQLTVMIVIIAFAVASTTLYTLYNTALQQERIRLTETVQSQARLIEAVAAFDQKFFQNDPNDAQDAVLEQLKTAHASYVGLGETGEFTLATLQNEEITFLLSHRHALSGKPLPVPIESKLAEPMRRALNGESTTLIGLDYRGEEVLAAAEPVSGLEWGLVAKIDLKEVQAPFIHAGFIALTLTTVLSVAGVGVFRRLTVPMINQLEESESRYHAVFDQAAVGIARVSTEGVLLEVNQKFCDIVGYTKSELLNSTFQQITHPDDLQQDIDFVNELLSGKSLTYSMEKRYYKKSGSLVWVNLTVSLICNEVDSSKYFISVIEDISSRKAIEQELADREKFITRTLDASLTGIHIFNLQTKTSEFINSRYTAITGYSLSDLQAMSAKEFVDLFHPSSRQYFVEHEALLAKSNDGEAIEIRYKFQRADGEWITLLAWNSVFDRDEKGDIVRVVGTFLDITEHEKDQEKLRQAAIVYANTIEGIIISDKRGNIIDVNPAFTRITGYSRDEVLGKNPSLFKSGQHDQEFYSKMWASLKNNGYWHGEIWNRRKDGAVYPALQTISSVLRSDGSPSQYIGVFSDITRIKQTEKELEFLAHHDSLTELPNRILFSSYLQQGIKSSARQGKSFAVVFMDIDQFKGINDSLGHTAGDQLLKQVAERMKDAVRDQDIVSRISGDEFVVLLEDIQDENHTLVAVEKLMSVFSKAFTLNDDSLRVTASMGICLYPQDASDADTLMRYADIAMYRAKESGRNTFHFFTPDMNASSLEYALISHAMSNANSHEELMLYYQPQFDLYTGDIVSVESLLRWNHPTLGLLLPACFIPIAEQSGTVNEIGRYVLEMGCKQGADWLAQGVDFGRLAINVSARQFQKESFASDILKVLDKYQFPPEYLELEITESTLLRRAEANVLVLQELRDRGISISIDDFGTGYSSLSYLSRLPVDKLKIDREFVRNLLVDRNHASIIISIIALGKALSMKVVAEGIETEVQAEFLKEVGCQYGQGYLCGMPLSSGEMTKRILQG